MGPGRAEAGAVGAGPPGERAAVEGVGVASGPAASGGSALDVSGGDAGVPGGLVNPEFGVPSPNVPDCGSEVSGGGAWGRGAGTVSGGTSGAVAPTWPDGGGWSAAGPAPSHDASHSGSVRSAADAAVRIPVQRLLAVGPFAMLHRNPVPVRTVDLTVRPARGAGNAREVPVGTRVGHGDPRVPKPLLRACLATTFRPTDRSRR